MIRNKLIVPKEYESCINCIEFVFDEHNSLDKWSSESCRSYDCMPNENNIIFPEYIPVEQELNYLRVKLKKYIKPKYL